jgi:rubrerythrin
MFTENDFLHYFVQLQDIEKKMYETYQNLYEQLENPEYKKIFGQMANEEREHDNLLESLKDLFATKKK